MKILETRIRVCVSAIHWCCYRLGGRSGFARTVPMARGPPPVHPGTTKVYCHRRWLTQRVRERVAGRGARWCAVYTHRCFVVFTNALITHSTKGPTAVATAGRGVAAAAVATAAAVAGGSSIRCAAVGSVQSVITLTTGNVTDVFTGVSPPHTSTRCRVYIARSVSRIPSYPPLKQQSRDFCVSGRATHVSPAQPWKRSFRNRRILALPSITTAHGVSPISGLINSD